MRFNFQPFDENTQFCNANLFVRKARAEINVNKLINSMQFNDYLALKKINPLLFQAQEPALYAEWKSLFEQVHPDSFTTLKKFLLNNVRRKHHLL